MPRKTDKNHTRKLDSSEGTDSLESEPSDFLPTAEEKKALADILGLLQTSTGIDFSHYRQTTVMRRLLRRFGFSKKDTLTEYAEFLKTNPDEVKELFRDLLLSFTTFFRDPHVFEALATFVYPALTKNRNQKSPLRIWVPGCATGEEVFSLAIGLTEYLETNNIKVPLQLFGTDLNEQHISKARSAIYSEKITQFVSPQRLERFFDPLPDGGYRITKHIRQMCVFAAQNVLSDPPFPHIDILSCRNLLIYLDSEFQEQIIPLFHFALQQDGFLLLGTSETLSRFEDLFSVVDKKSNIYRKLLVKDVRPYRIPFSRTIRKHEEKKASLPQGAVKSYPGGDSQSTIDRILLDNYTPPAILVDGTMQIRSFRGNVAPFLGPGSGEATLKLSSMIREELMPDLYVAIQEAKKSGKKVTKDNAFLYAGNNETSVSLTVFPVTQTAPGDVAFLIVLETPPKVAVATTTAASFGDTRPSDETSALRKELMTVKEHLQAIIEEKDDVNQELWAANEEVQSTNEELQSVNEEMEAAKEELESGNEELMTLNEELVQSNAAIKQSEDRFKALVEASSDWIWEADTEGKYTYASPTVKEILGYAPDQVIGRRPFDLMPIEEANRCSETFAALVAEHKPIVAMENVNLHKDGHEVILETSGVPFFDSQGKLAGYRGIDRDVTERIKNTEALKLNELWLRRALSISNIVYFTFDLQGSDNYWSSEMYRMFGFEPSDTPPPFEQFLERIHPEDRPQHVASQRKVIETGKRHVDVCRTNPSYGPIRYIQTVGVADFNEAGEVWRVVGTLQDITAQKLLEQQLSESEAKYRFIVEHARELFLVVNLKENKFEFVSPAITNILGYSPDALTDSHTMSAYVHDEDKPQLEKRIENIRRAFKDHQKELPYFEARYRHKDGHYVWLQTSGRIIYDDDGMPSMFIDLARDITARKNAETALRLSEEKHRLLLEKTSEKFIAISPEGKYHFVNHAYAEAYGRTPEEMIGKTLWDVFPHDEAQKRLASIQQTVAKKRRTGFEIKSLLPTGETKYFQSLLEPVYEESGQLLWVLGIVMDVTERRQSEEALRLSESRLKQAQKFARIGSWSWHIKTNQLEWSDEMYAIFGLDKEIVSQGLEEVLARAIHPQDRAIAEAFNLSVVRDKKPMPIEYRVIWPDNTVHTIWSEAGDLVLDDDGNPELLMGIAQDITERRQIEEALMNTQKLESLGALAGGIAHDFNNLLSGIFGFIDIAAAITTEEKVGQYLTKTLGTLERARALTGQLLTFAKGGAPNKKLQRLPEFIEATATFALSGSSVSCRFNIPTDLWECEFDENQIGQVIDNIVINAQHAMPTGGKIEIVAQNQHIAHNAHPSLEEGNYVQIAIRDEGIGIPESILSKIFDPFFSTKTRGHGLGLAMCHSIITRHGGHIGVQSEPGIGSTFTFYLPAESELTAPESDLPVAVHRGSGDILLMDDEAVIRDTIDAMLSDMGYSVHCVRSSDAAIEAFINKHQSQSPFCALIFDLTIPGEPGGKETIVEIRRVDKDTPAFVLSGYADDPVMANPANYGFTASIRKPFRRAELAKLLNKYIKTSPPQ